MQTLAKASNGRIIRLSDNGRRVIELSEDRDMRSATCGKLVVVWARDLSITEITEIKELGQRGPYTAVREWLSDIRLAPCPEEDDDADRPQ